MTQSMYPACYQFARERFPNYTLFFYYPADEQYVAFDQDAQLAAAHLLHIPIKPDLTVFTFDRAEARMINAAITNDEGMVKIIHVS